VSVVYGTTRNPVLFRTMGDVCLQGRMSGLAGLDVVGMARRARGSAFQRWAHPSIQVTTTLKAFAASPYQGADP
jgi:hypothetical protein